MDKCKGRCPSHLKIDQEKTVNVLENYLRKTAEEQNAKGVILDLNGGLDSAVLACLAVRALGPQAVHTFYLYDRHSEKHSRKKAKMLAEWLGITLEIENITQDMAKGGVYASHIMNGRGLPRWLNRIVQKAYFHLFGETPLVSSLRIGSGTANFSHEQRIAYDLTIRPIIEGVETRQIHRRTILEQKARKTGSLLLGAVNRSNDLIGWFIKDGIDGLPIQPLSGLYKSQLRQLACCLNIPEEICSGATGPDMRHRITGEYGMGISYETLDGILDMLAKGMSESEILAQDVAPQDLAMVCELHRLSAWKRTNHALKPPVDGGPFSALRISFQRESIINHAIMGNKDVKASPNTCWWAETKRSIYW